MLSIMGGAAQEQIKGVDTEVSAKLSSLWPL